MKLESITFKDVNKSCPICLNDNCPSRETCLRYQLGLLAGDDDEVHLCVLPRALKGDRCRLFNSADQIPVAYGFEGLFDRLKGKDVPVIRKALKQYYGYNVKYYQSVRGERAIKSDEQQFIVNLLKEHGYTDIEIFDRFDQVYEIAAVQY